jgi:FkbM family methyltransferase
VRFRLRLPEDKLIWTGTWEIALAEAISESVHPGDVCFDIGSYHGFFAGVMWVAGASAIHCFEPNPANLATIHELKELNPGLPIEVHGLAIGGEDSADAEFATMPELTMGKLATSTFQPGALRGDSLRVRLARLDSLLRDATIPAPDVIKIDVEGAELDVLLGAQSLLTTVKPGIFLEAHSPQLARDCNALLESVGYVVTVLETGRKLSGAPEMEICHLVARRG